MSGQITATNKTGGYEITGTTEGDKRHLDVKLSSSDISSLGGGSIVSDLKGTGAMSAAITIGGTGYLSNDDVSRLSSAVWDEAIADHQDAGTTGEALSDAGAAGNPWSALIASNNTPDTFGWFIQKLLTVAKFLGLK